MRTQRHDCPRCHGMMVEAYSDLASPDSTGNDMIGWRCINCGEYVDRLVLLNRWAQQGADPLNQQALAERLLDIVVSAHPQTQHLVDLIIL